MVHWKKATDANTLGCCLEHGRRFSVLSFKFLVGKDKNSLLVAISSPSAACSRLNCGQFNREQAADGLEMATNREFLSFPTKNLKLKTENLRPCSRQQPSVFASVAFFQ